MSLALSLLRFSQCLRITNPKFPHFLRKFFIEIKFFSASPRLRGATGFSGFSPCLSCLSGGFWVWLWLCYAMASVVSLVLGYCPPLFVASFLTPRSAARRFWANAYVDPGPSSFGFG